MRIFRYIPEVDAFVLTPEYDELAHVLGIEGWESFAWIGRLFSLDNDVGEHWFDNHELREERRELASKHGYEAESLLIIDPKSMADGRDGPCHSDEFRARFWHNVLTTLDLDEEVIIAEARSRPWLCETAEDVADLEARVDAWRRTRRPQ